MSIIGLGSKPGLETKTVSSKPTLFIPCSNAEQYAEQLFSRYGAVSKTLVRENKNHPGKWFAIVEFSYWTNEEVRQRLVAGEQIRFANFFGKFCPLFTPFCWLLVCSSTDTEVRRRLVALRADLLSQDPW